MRPLGFGGAISVAVGAKENGGPIPSRERSCEKIKNRLLPALSVRRSARATLVERALRARFHLWVRGQGGSGLAQLIVFTASGARAVRRWGELWCREQTHPGAARHPSGEEIFLSPTTVGKMDVVVQQAAPDVGSLSSTFRFQHPQQVAPVLIPLHRFSHEPHLCGVNEPHL